MDHPNSKIEMEEIYNETHPDYMPENFDPFDMERLVDSGGNLIDNNGDAEPDMEELPF